MAVCANCGTSNIEGTKFCVSCGAQLGEAPAPESWRASSELGTPPAATPTDATGYAPNSSVTGGYAATDPSTVPSSSQPGAMSGRAGLFSIGEKRDPMMVVLFTLLTCGIYGIFWWHTTITEIKNALGRQDINPGMEILLVFLTCGIYGFYLYYKYPQLMLEMQDRAGKPRNDITMMSLLLAICGLAVVSIPVMQSELNNIWDAAAHR